MNTGRRPGRRTREEAAQTRIRILDAAEERFGAAGYAAVSVREIAEAAGVQPYTVQHHFDSKALLYYAVMNRWNEVVQDVIRDAMKGITSFPEMVEAAIDTTFDFFVEHRSWVRMAARVAIGERLPEGIEIKENRWARFTEAEYPLAGASGVDLRMVLIPVEGVLNVHTLAAKHYKQLYGKTLDDPELRAQVKAHVKAVGAGIVNNAALPPST